MLGRARLRAVQRTRLTLTAAACLRPSPELRLRPDRAAAGLRAGLATLTNDAETRLKGWNELWPLRRPVPPNNPSTIRVHLASQGSAIDVAGGVWRPADALAKEPPAVATNPVVGALVNGQPWDLFRPLTHDAEVRILRFDDPAGRAIYWHSAAHLLGAALESVLGAEVRLTDGPPLLDAEGGFFYEMWLANNRRISPDDYEALERAMRPVVKDSERFLRMEVSAAEAAFLFESNPFKREMLAKIPAGERITLYRVGSFVDLCRGPHVPHAGVFKGFSLFKSSGSHWPLPAPGQRGAEVWDDSTRAQVLGDRANDVLLQRIYGVAFPTKPQLDEWKHRIEEAKRRDHRVVGRDQKLFFFHDLSPGSAFLLPHGTRIFERLIRLLRAEYRRQGYLEVMSPQVFKPDLWKTSGHWDNYKENMFIVAAFPSGNDASPPPTPTAATPRIHLPSPAASSSTHRQPHHHAHHQHPHSDRGHPSGHADEEEGGCCGGHDHSHLPHNWLDLDAAAASGELFGLKPMNCPGHCLMFAHETRSFRDLPLRLADFSPLHRNEASGALGGMTRLRRFHQDDAHIFCTEAQIGPEVAGCLAFVRRIYGLFGFPFRLRLSTRPDKFVGDLATWDRAEHELRTSLANAGFEGKVDVDEGGGAFYGPKIDVAVTDALGREHQCATIQLDFQLPQRFGLKYTASNGELAQPVIIHRAILGSLERFFAILIEHLNGKWPFWLSPRQVLVCTVADRHEAAAVALQTQLRDRGIYADVDSSGRTVPKKIRDGQLSRFNVMAVVGDHEATNGRATLRFRDAETATEFGKLLSVEAKEGSTVEVPLEAFLQACAAANADPLERV